jgi:hypothetical protein
MTHLILDIEIQRTIEETPGGWDATDLLGVSIAVVYDVGEDRYTIYGDSLQDRIDLQTHINRADRLTTFNGWKFDLPVIWGKPQPQRVMHLAHTSDDLLRRIWQGLGLDPDVFTKAHGGWGLDAVCKATLGRGKTGDGAQAPRLYQQGRWVELINYCLEDVRLTRDLWRASEDMPIAGPNGIVTLVPWPERQASHDPQ